MEGGISNKTIVRFFTKSRNDEVNNFIGIFPFNFVNRFISFHNMISESGTQYPFVIMSTDQTDKKGTHWWSFFDLHPKKETFLFDNFGFEGLKEFIIQDNDRSSIRYITMLESLIKKTIKLL